MSDTVILLELTAQAWPRCMRSGAPNASGSRMIGRTRAPITASHTYRITGKLRRSATANGAAYVLVMLYDTAGAVIPGPGAQWWWLGAASGVAPGTGWTTYTATFGAGTANTFPAGAASVLPLVILNNAGSAGSMDCRELWVEDTAAAGVPISVDRTMRMATEWDVYGGTPASFVTLIGPDVEPVAYRFATGSYVTQRTDTPSATQYDARLQQPGVLRMEMPAELCGSSTTTLGEIVLDNADGAITPLVYQGVSGQPFALKMGRVGAPLASFARVLSGTMDQVIADHKTARIRLRAPDAPLSQPLARSTYLGTNPLPSGVEGTPDDLGGHPKPRVYGYVLNVAPPCVNTTLQIYQLHDFTPLYLGATTNVGPVLDAGVPLTLSAASPYISQADMETNAPAPGEYRVWPAGGFFRLGAAPAGLVTCNADRGLTQVRDVVREMASDMGLALYGSSLTPLAAPDNYTGTWPTQGPDVGGWVDDLATAAQALDTIAKGAGVWWGFAYWAGMASGLGFDCEAFPPPIASASGAPAFDQSNILSLTALSDPGPGRGAVAWKVDLACQPNQHTMSPSELASSVNAAQRAYFASPGPRVQTSDITILAQHASARQIVRDTSLTTAAAQSEADRQLKLTRYPRRWFELRAPLQAVLDMTTQPRLGGYVRLDWPGLQVLWQDGVTRDWGYFNVMAFEADFKTRQVRLSIRQATEPS